MQQSINVKSTLMSTVKCTWQNESRKRNDNKKQRSCKLNCAEQNLTWSTYKTECKHKHVEEGDIEK